MGTFPDDPGHDPDSVGGPTWTVLAELECNYVRALVDSGAGESLVSHHLLRQNPGITIRRAATRCFQGAWGKYKADTVAEVPFKVESTLWVVTAYVCDGLPFHLILGSRFISKYGWQLDGRRGCVKVGNRYLAKVGEIANDPISTEVSVARTAPLPLQQVSAFDDDGDLQVSAVLPMGALRQDDPEGPYGISDSGALPIDVIVDGELSTEGTIKRSRGLIYIPPGGSTNLRVTLRRYGGSVQDGTLVCIDDKPCCGVVPLSFESKAITWQGGIMTTKVVVTNLDSVTWPQDLKARLTGARVVNVANPEDLLREEASCIRPRDGDALTKAAEGRRPWSLYSTGSMSDRRQRSWRGENTDTSSHLLVPLTSAANTTYRNRAQEEYLCDPSSSMEVKGTPAMNQDEVEMTRDWDRSKGSRGVNQRDGSREVNAVMVNAGGVEQGLRPRHVGTMLWNSVISDNTNDPPDREIGDRVGASGLAATSVMTEEEGGWTIPRLEELELDDEDYIEWEPPEADPQEDPVELAKAYQSMDMEVTQEQRARVAQTLGKYLVVFNPLRDRLGRYRGPMYRVRTGDHPPVYVKQFPVPQKHSEYIGEAVKKMLTEGAIVERPELAPTGWNIPFFVVPKPGGVGDR